MKIYDVSLCVVDKNHFNINEIFDHDFALKIHYNMDIKKTEIIKSSLAEMERYSKISNQEEQQYYHQLNNIFPDVQKNDIIIAQYHHLGHIIFFHNNIFIGKILNPELSKIFLDIWLHPQNKYRKMTKNLFKNNG